MNGKNMIVRKNYKTTLIALLAVILVSTLLLCCACDFLFSQLESITAVYNGDDLEIGETVSKSDVTVTAKYTDGSSRSVTNFTLGECDTTSAGVKTVTVTYTEFSITKTTTITVTVVESEQPPKPVVLQSISAVYNGANLNVGNTLAKSNIAVTAHYSDNSSKSVTDFTVGECDTSSAGAKIVTVSYTENGVTKETTFTVTVVEPEPVVLQSITAQYVGADLFVGDEINKDDIIVTAFYSDGSSKSVTDFIIGTYDTSTLGIKYISIYVPRDDGNPDLFDTITVKVVAKLESIEVEYTGGDLIVDLAIDTTQITVTAHYDDGSSKTVSGYTLSETSFATTGEKTVTVTYVENGVTKTDTFTVRVVVASLARIEAVYIGGMVLIGNQPDINYLVVTAYYDNGLSKVVTNVNFSTIDSDTEGEKDWEISYTENGVTQSVVIKITVTETKEPREGDYDVNVIKNENLSIHFLELGNKYTGDSVYIKAGDTDILIDAGSRKDSAAAISRYVNQYCTDGILEYVIATHAHQDHIAGFVGNSNKGIFDLYECKNIIEFARTNSTTAIYSDYQQKRNAEKAAGANVFTALDCVNNANGAKKVYDLTGDGSITMEILYQDYYSQKTSNENNYSVCLMISQGDNHYLFTGDLEGEGETSLVNNNPNLPEMELWKGGHHGSYTAASNELMSKIKPKCVCICTCMGTTEYTTGDNVFPAQSFINRVAPYTDRVYVTTYAVNYSAGNYQSANGNIVFACTNGQITMYFTGNNLKLKDTDWFKSSRTCPSAWR